MTEVAPAHVPIETLRQRYNTQFQAVCSGKAKSYQDLHTLISQGQAYYGSMFKKDGNTFSFIKDEKTSVPIGNSDFPFFDFHFYQLYLRAGRNDFPLEENAPSVEQDFCRNMAIFFMALAHPEPGEAEPYLVTGYQREYDTSTAEKRAEYARIADNWWHMEEVALLAKEYRRTGRKARIEDIQREGYS